MTKATDIQAIDTLLSTPAANADQVAAWQGPEEIASVALSEAGNDASATGAWDAFDVWRRLIKEPRDRRRPQPG